jgi:hypothetical protein
MINQTGATMKDLNLSPSQQSMVAELCGVIAGLLRDGDAVDPVKTVEKVLEVVWSYDATPQTFDSLYDKFHRYGANAHP